VNGDTREKSLKTTGEKLLKERPEQDHSQQTHWRLKKGTARHAHAETHIHRCVSVKENQNVKADWKNAAKAPLPKRSKLKLLRRTTYLPTSRVSHNRDAHVITDHDAFISMSRQNQHGWLLLKKLCVPIVSAEQSFAAFISSSYAKVQRNTR